MYRSTFYAKPSTCASDQIPFFRDCESGKRAAEKGERGRGEAVGIRKAGKQSRRQGEQESRSYKGGGTVCFVLSVK